jgi:hypothetical protein
MVAPKSVESVRETGRLARLLVRKSRRRKKLTRRAHATAARGWRPGLCGTRKWAGFRELSPCGILFLYSFSLLFSIPKFNFNSNLNSTIVANFILRLKLKLDIFTMWWIYLFISLFCVVLYSFLVFKIQSSCIIEDISIYYFIYLFVIIIIFPYTNLGFTNPTPLTEISPSRFVRKIIQKALFVV